MNERIRELNLKAISHILNGNNPDGDVDLMYIPAEFTKKFAELIVKECVKAADEWYQYHNEIQWDPGEHIKQHFGVEQ